MRSGVFVRPYQAMSHTIKFILAALAAVSVGVTAPLIASPASSPDSPQVARPQRTRLTVTPAKKLPKRHPKHGRNAQNKPKPAAPVSMKAVVIDEPNTQEGTISVVTEANEFATVVAGMGTRIARGYQLTSLGNIHAGYTLRCTGGWDRDGFQYQANRIALGGTVKDTDVIARVNAACQNIGKARKGGGFGQSLVATVPPSAAPNGNSIGGKPFAPPSPIPTGLIPEQTPTGAQAPAAQPTAPVTAPGMVPALPGTAPQTVPATPTNPGTVPVPPQTVPAPPPTK